MLIQNIIIIIIIIIIIRGEAASRCAGTSQYPALWLSHVTEAAREAGAAAELAATRKEPIGKVRGHCWSSHV